eukprot:gene251-biopygen113745
MSSLLRIVLFVPPRDPPHTTTVVYGKGPPTAQPDDAAARCSTGHVCTCDGTVEYGRGPGDSAQPGGAGGCSAARCGAGIGCTTNGWCKAAVSGTYTSGDGFFESKGLSKAITGVSPLFVHMRLLYTCGSGLCGDPCHGQTKECRCGAAPSAMPTVSPRSPDLALGMPTAQSSTAYSSGVGTTDPWWRVDLGAEYRVGIVRVTNRADCCSDRLNGFEVRAGSMKGDGSANHNCGNGGMGNGSVGAGATIEVQCSGQSARYVNVRVPGGDKILTLCAVEVLAFPTASPSGDWYDSGVDTNCDDGCAAVGLVCTEQQLQLHNNDVDTSGEVTAGKFTCNGISGIECSSDKFATMTCLCTVPSAIPSTSPASNSTDPTCATGILGGPSHPNACCSTGCGICGGTGCGTRPGGEAHCCGGWILNTSVMCASAMPPCVLSTTQAPVTPTVTPVSKPSVSNATPATPIPPTPVPAIRSTPAPPPPSTTPATPPVLGDTCILFSCS